MTSIEYGLIVMAVMLGLLAAYFLAGDALEEIMMTAVSGLEHANSDTGSGSAFDQFNRRFK